MRKLFIIALLASTFNLISEETISRWMSDYFQRIHGFIADENYEKALYELDMGVNSYFRNGRTYAVSYTHLTLPTR